MKDANEAAREICQMPHGYGGAVDPTCANCARIAAFLSRRDAEVRAEAERQVSLMRPVVEAAKACRFGYIDGKAVMYRTEHPEFNDRVVKLVDSLAAYSKGEPAPVIEKPCACGGPDGHKGPCIGSKPAPPDYKEESK